MNKIIIACSKKWFFKNDNVKKFIKKKNVIIITSRDKLKLKYLKKLKPSKIFFPHWSYKVPITITKHYNCICFHTSPLPFGRGGSPIQNLILLRKKFSPVCALKMTDKIDAGPIYLKKKISLSGNLDTIFSRIADSILIMIKMMIKKTYKSKFQKGNIFYFKRISKKLSKIQKNLPIGKIYDQIRMLDSKEYPVAYFKFQNIKIELSNAKLKNKIITCDAKIIKDR